MPFPMGLGQQRCFQLGPKETSRGSKETSRCRNSHEGCYKHTNVSLTYSHSQSPQRPR